MLYYFLFTYSSENIEKAGLLSKTIINNENKITSLNQEIFDFKE